MDEIAYGLGWIAGILGITFLNYALAKRKGKDTLVAIALSLLLGIFVTPYYLLCRDKNLTKYPKSINQK